MFDEKNPPKRWPIRDIVTGTIRSALGHLLHSLFCNKTNLVEKNICSNSMNVIIGLCHSYSGKVVTFQVFFFFACKRKLSKTSRLLRLAATGNCPCDRGSCQ